MVEADAPVTFCTNCGMRFSPGRFCAHCGASPQVPTTERRVLPKVPAIDVRPQPAVRFHRQPLAGSVPYYDTSTGRLLGAWVGSAFGTFVLITSLSITATYVTRLTLADTGVAQALIAIVASLAVAALFGGLVLWFSARTYAKVVFCSLAVFLVTAGFLMLVMAPVLRQMNTPDVAEYRAFRALIIFGLLSSAAGIALGVQCFRWAMRPHAREKLKRWSRLLGSAYGVMLGISGVFGAISLLLVANGGSNSETSVVERSISLAAIVMWSLVPGIILTYHGISASMRERSAPFRPPVAWIALSLYAAVLLIGGLNMAAVHPVAAPMPPLHVLAAALPGITLVAFAARGALRTGKYAGGLSWRQLTLALAISMTVGTTIAVYVETVGSFGGVLLLLVHNGAFRHVTDNDGFWQVVRDSDSELTRNEQFFANLITASLLAPLIEEFGKGLGVRFMLRPLTTRAQAFLMGAAAGAGFGFLEAMLYGVSSIQQDGPGSWWVIMLVRGGSTSLHVFNTGLVGLAWWYAINGQRKRRAWSLFAVAVTMHALWNGFAVAIATRILGIDTLSDRTIEVVAYAVIVALAAAFILAVPLIARLVREPDPPPAAGTPLAAMSPWLA